MNLISKSSVFSNQNCEKKLKLYLKQFENLCYEDNFKKLQYFKFQK